MTYSQDHLYDLLPAIHRSRDAEQGYPLRALLRVINEQVKVVEDDIAQLYDNWFIETCQDWVAPYIGDLVGYQPVHEAGEPGAVTTPQSRQRNKILIPRREVANTIYYRRRKGTLALLEVLAQEVAGWPARAVEFYKLLGWTQHLNHQRPAQGRTVDLRNGEALDQLDGPFDALAHTVDVRRVASQQGRYNIPSVGVFVWRLRSYSVTQAPAYRVDPQSHCFTFSIAGNDIPLYNRPQPEAEPTHIAEELNLPTPIRRRRFETHKTDYYGERKSLQIWKGKPMSETISKKDGVKSILPAQRQLLLPEKIVPANLERWDEPEDGYVAVDPELGRIAFSQSLKPTNDEVVWVTYHYGFSADIGGGEYERPMSQPLHYALYRVGEREQFKTIPAAYDHWKEAYGQWQEAYEQRKKDKDEKSQEANPFQHAIIEIADNGLYEEELNIVLKQSQSLQLRAANRKRPVLGITNELQEWDTLNIAIEPGCRFVLDGLYVVGGAVRISDIQEEEQADDENGIETTEPQVQADKQPATDTSKPHIIDEEIERPTEVIIRHSTLVPGWLPECDHHEHLRHDKGSAIPSLVIEIKANVIIEHSILGAIQVGYGLEPADPGRLCISDSILDALDADSSALELTPEGQGMIANTLLSITRSTVIGQVQTHAIGLAENCIFDGIITVARSQLGCMRFCYITPGSRTPQRFECQPELAEQEIEAKLRNAYANQKPQEVPTKEEIDAAKRLESERVKPQFISKQYGTPGYCQLVESCAEEITRGAEDESEMGAFHDLYQPQRAANLRARLNEYTPAGMEVGIIYAS